MSSETKKFIEAQKTVKILKVYNSITGKTTTKFSSREKGIDQILRVVKDKPLPEINKLFGVKTISETKKYEPKRPAKCKDCRFIFTFVREKEIKKHRTGTKRETILQMLLEGSTFNKIRNKYNWNERQTYEAIRMVHIAWGYGLRTELISGIITAY